MEWRDQGILIAVRKHGETSAILEVFTPLQGRHAGVLRGASSRKIAPILQPGAQLDLQWRARLEDHIGSFSVEPLQSRAAMALADRQSLAGLNAVTSLLSHALPEREPHPALYERTKALLDILDEAEVWPIAYLRWELALLEELGYGLDLSACAVTGQADNLVYVSPKSGRAVSLSGAGDWVDRLLPLPQIFLHGVKATSADLMDGFRTTGYFLQKSLAEGTHGRPLPQARQRFLDVLSRRLSA